MGFLGYTQTTYPAPHWSWSWCRNPGDTSLKVHHFRTGTRWNHGGFPWLFVLLEGKYMICLVVWNMCYFPYIGNVIIPTDEFIFFRGVGQPPTRYTYIWIYSSYFSYPHLCCFNPIHITIKCHITTLPEY